MKEVTGNIWEYHKKGHWIVITTNGTVRSTGEAVMGKGIALQARWKYPFLPIELGQLLSQGTPSRVFPFSSYKLLTFPTKYHWWEKADLHLIEESAKQLSSLVPNEKVYLVRPGCSSGGLNWVDVKPILEKYLDDRFIVVELEGHG